MREDLSVIVPVYNHKDYLAKNLDSILEQKTKFSIKIYILDDASNDGSAEIIKKYAQDNPQKILVYTSPYNLGSGKLSHYYHKPKINGKYWCILEGDDYWIDNEKVEKQITFLENNSDYVGCGSKNIINNISTNTQTIYSPDRDSYNILDLMLLDKKYAFYIHTSTIIWRNIYKKSSSYLPPSFKKSFVNGDLMLLFIILGNGGKMKCLSDVMSFYNYTGIGKWSKFSEEEQKSTHLLLQKGIQKIIPLKYKLYAKIFIRFEGLRKFIPSPINS